MYYNVAGGLDYLIWKTDFDNYHTNFSLVGWYI